MVANGPNFQRARSAGIGVFSATWRQRSVSVGPFLSLSLVFSAIGGITHLFWFEPTSVRAQQSVPESVSAISGTVTVALTGAPIAGAIVSLIGDRGQSSSQSTDSAGRFIFMRLAPSDAYQLVASKAGFAPLNIERRVILRPREWVSGVHVQLSRFAAISGRVTQESGEPVVGVFVRAMARTFVGGSEQLVGGPIGKTDDRGIYRLANLVPGRYLVKVPSIQESALLGTDLAATLRQELPKGTSSSDPLAVIQDGGLLIVSPSAVAVPSGTVNEAYPTFYHPSARSPAGAMIIELVSGEVRSNIHVSLARSPTVTVSGLVEGPPDVRAGMVLRLLPEGLEGLFNGNEIATALVAPTGRFVFLGVPPGAYVLVGSGAVFDLQLSGGQSFTRLGTLALPLPQGLKTTLLAGAALSSGIEYRYGNESERAEYAGRSKVVVGTAPLKDLVLQLRRGVTISGRVVVEGDDRITTRPLLGVGTFPVIAEPADCDFLFGLPNGRMVPSGTTATFSVGGVQPGRYFLRFPALGVLGATVVKSVVWRGRDYSSQGLAVAPDEDVTDVIVTASVKAPTIVGQVTEAQQPISPATRVVVFPTDPARRVGYGLSSSRIQSVSLDNINEFRTSLDVAGEYFAIALDRADDRIWQDPRFLEAASKIATRVVVTWGNETRINLATVTLKAVR